MRRARTAQFESSSMRYNASVSPPTESLVEVRRFPNCLLNLPGSLTPYGHGDRILAYTSEDCTGEIDVWDSLWINDLSGDRGNKRHSLYPRRERHYSGKTVVEGK